MRIAQLCPRSASSICEIQSGVSRIGPDDSTRGLLRSAGNGLDSIADDVLLIELAARHAPELHTATHLEQGIGRRDDRAEESAGRIEHIERARLAPDVWWH